MRRLATEAVAWATSLDGADDLADLRDDLAAAEAAITAAAAAAVAAAAVPAPPARVPRRARRANANANPANLTPAQQQRLALERAEQAARTAAQAAAAKAAAAAARETARDAARDRVTEQRRALPPQTTDEWEDYAKEQAQPIVTYLIDALGGRHKESLSLFEGASVFDPVQVRILLANSV